MSNPKHGRWWDDVPPAPEPPQQWEPLPRTPTNPWGAGFRWFPDRPDIYYQAPRVGERMGQTVTMLFGKPVVESWWWTGLRWLPLGVWSPWWEPEVYGPPLFSASEFPSPTGGDA